MITCTKAAIIFNSCLNLIPQLLAPTVYCALCIATAVMELRYAKPLALQNPLQTRHP